MNPRKSTSSFSKRVKIRRKPFKRRNRRSTSLRRVYVEWPVVRPGGESVLAGRHHGREPEGHREVAGLLALVGTVHH